MRWRMASNGPAGNGLSRPRDPLGEGFSRSLSRTWESEKGRRRLIRLTVAVIVIVIVGLGALMFSSLSGESQSYRDGYSAGETAYGLYSSESAQQACNTVELHGSGLGGLGRGDNPTQWIQGCVASFNATAADS
jgi:hypothetical protein